MTLPAHLATKTLDEVDSMHRYGTVSDEELALYVHEWNTGAFRFNHAYIDSGRIRLHDAETPHFRCLQCAEKGTK